MSSLGRPRPRFLVVVGVLAAAAAGYAVWWAWRPDPFAGSELVVRKFAADARKLVGAYRRSLVAVTQTHGGTAADVAAREAAIDARRDVALESLRSLAEAARANLDELEGISLGTLRNRLGRVDRRLDEAAAMLRDEAARAKKEARGTASAEPSPSSTVHPEP